MSDKRSPFQVGQVVHAWNNIRIIKITRKYYRKKGDKFDGWWYEDAEEQAYSERECKALTKRECGA